MLGCRSAPSHTPALLTEQWHTLYWEGALRDLRVLRGLCVLRGYTNGQGVK
jgi:hypothetical protein